MSILRFADLFWNDDIAPPGARLLSAGQGYSPSLGAGVAVLPSPTTYTAYSIAAGATVQLQWPTDNFPANANVVALLMNITPLGSGCALQMPSALNTSLGEKTVVFNSGSDVLLVLDSTGAPIAPIGPGIGLWFALQNNLNAAGTWLSLTFGAGTSAANAAQLAGPGLAAAGTVLQQIMNIVTLNTNYTVGAPDRDNCFNWVAGSGTVTLPLASAVGNDFYVQLRNSGSGTLTVATSGSDLINGNASQSFAINDSAFIATDGTTWITIGLGTAAPNAFNFQIVNLGGQTGTFVLPANLQGKVAYRFTGALAGNTIIQVPATIAQYWVDNETTGGTLAIGTATQIAATQQFALTAGARFILYCDGSNVLNGDTASIAVPLGISQGGTGATTASGARASLGGTSIGSAVFTAPDTTTAQTALAVNSASDTEAWSLIF